MTKSKSQSILIVSGQHFISAPRKVDLHLLADQCVREGLHVDFLSVRLSRLSRLTSDPRWAFAASRSVNRWTSISEATDEFIWCAPFHPVNLGNRYLNAATAMAARIYPALLPRAVTARLPTYSTIVIESGLAALLFSRLKRGAPDARFVYHAADSLSVIGAHPAIGRALRRSANQYDLVCVVAEAIADEDLQGANTAYVPHAVDHAQFAQSTATPYTGPNNAVSAGDMLFDDRVMLALAEAWPEWTFHLFGARSRLARTLPNVIAHGEQPFETVVRYLQHADVGLALYRDEGNAAYLAQSSLKLLHYTLCRLPILAPAFAASAGRPHICSYDPKNMASVARAFRAATNYPRDTITAESIPTLSEITAKILGREHVAPSP